MDGPDPVSHLGPKFWTALWLYFYCVFVSHYIMSKSTVNRLAKAFATYSSNGRFFAFFFFGFWFLVCLFVCFFSFWMMTSQLRVSAYIVLRHCLCFSCDCFFSFLFWLSFFFVPWIPIQVLWCFPVCQNPIFFCMVYLIFLSPCLRFKVEIQNLTQSNVDLFIHLFLNKCYSHSLLLNSVWIAYLISRFDLWFNTNVWWGSWHISTWCLLIMTLVRILEDAALILR